MTRYLSCFLLFGLVLPAHAADGDTADPESLKKVLTDFSADLSIPDSPGLSIVGLGAENVLRPATPRALGLAAVQGRNEDGSQKQGFAVDFAPMKLLASTTTKAEYKSSRWIVRPLWNTQLSFGAGQPLSDQDKSTRTGVGLSTILWRSELSDPYLDEKHGSCLDKALLAAQPATFPGMNADVQNAAGRTAAREMLKKCYEALEERTWNASALMLGVATATVSGRDPAIVPDAHPRGYWVSFNYGFEGIPRLQRVLQFTATYRRLDDELVKDSTDATRFVAQDSNLLGAKLYGRWSAANLFLEASRQRATVTSRATEHADLYVLGVERKLAENLWLTLALGKKRGGTAENPTSVSTGLKFGYDEAAVIK